MMPRLFLAAVATLLTCTLALAQDWPAKPVRLIVPFGAGSTPDIVMRIVAERLQQKLGQPFVVENKAGASGNIGTDAAAKAEPDGYTFGLSIVGPLALNKFLFAALPYDPQRDLVPVTLVSDQPSILAVNADVPATDVASLVAWMKRDAASINYGSIGNGSLSHLAMEAIAIKSGVKLTHIPYASSPQAMTALLRGDVQIVCLPAISVASLMDNPRVRAIAVTSAKRSPLLPALPTLRETGIDVEANAWNGLVAPVKTPRPVLDAMSKATAEVLAEPDIREKLKAQMMSPIASTPEGFRALIDAEIARWEPVIKAADIKIN